jgi:hypothetical protein
MGDSSVVNLTNDISSSNEHLLTTYVHLANSKNAMSAGKKCNSSSLEPK